MTNTMRMFIPIIKVDLERRIVTGIVTDESRDRAGEVCDYASSKPFFQAWSAEVDKNTGGKSKGNVRAMHGNIAAGKLTAIDFNDANKSIEVAAKIVDDDEWMKVQEGVYTGFSQGGRYVRRWPDPEDNAVIRFTADPHEISLVDLPCLPTATFSIIKADGTSMSKAFKSVIKEPSEMEIDRLAEKIMIAESQAQKDIPDNEKRYTSVENAKKLAREQLIKDELAKGPLQTNVNDALDPLAPPSGNGVGTVADGAISADVDSAPIDRKGDIDGPSADAIKARAVEMAAAEGVEVTADHHRKAAAELMAQGIAENPAKTVPTSDVSEASPSHEATETVKTVGTDDTPQGFWSGETMEDPDGKFYLKKKDAERAKKNRRIARALSDATGELDADLADISIELWKRDYSTEERKKGAAEGWAKDDGSYPIRNAKDVRNAVMDFHRGKGGSASDRAHIIARAKALGIEDPFKTEADKVVSGDIGTVIAKVAVPMSANTTSHVHAQMAHFHGSHAGMEGGSGEMHKGAAGAHAEAFLAHLHDQADAMGKSDMAWSATCKCYGMGKEDGGTMMAMFAPAEMTKALRSKTLNKGLPCVAQFAMVIQSLEYIVNDCRWEAEVEGDNSPVPAMLAMNAKSLCTTLKAMLDEEVSELASGKETEFYDNAAKLPKAQRDAVIKYLKASPGTIKAGEAIEALSKGELDTSIAALATAVAECNELEKLGARHSARDQDRVQKVHDLATDLGAGCPAAASAKAASDAKIAELQDTNAALTAKFADLGPEIADLKKRLQTVEAMPLPAKAALRAPETEVAPGGITAEAIAKMSTSEVCKLIDGMDLKNDEKTAWKIRVAMGRPTHIKA